jgi:mRNA-degrading endonuclease RelE of RelBE toxin-antitoxin system
MAFKIDLSPNAQKHIKPIRKSEQTTILDAIEEQLSHQPEQPTRRRKKLEENPLAPWELRVGEFRIFYDVDADEKLVVVVAIGRKSHNRLTIGGEEFELCK